MWGTCGSGAFRSKVPFILQSKHSHKIIYHLSIKLLGWLKYHALFKKCKCEASPPSRGVWGKWCKCFCSPASGSAEGFPGLLLACANAVSWVASTSNCTGKAKVSNLHSAVLTPMASSVQRDAVRDRGQYDALCYAWNVLVHKAVGRLQITMVNPSWVDVVQTHQEVVQKGVDLKSQCGSARWPPSLESSRQPSVVNGTQGNILPVTRSTAANFTGQKRIVVLFMYMGDLDSISLRKTNIYM